MASLVFQSQGRHRRPTLFIINGDCDGVMKGGGKIMTKQQEMRTLGVALRLMRRFTEAYPERVHKPADFIAVWAYIVRSVTNMVKDDQL